ncbi:hypothetical protein HDU93_007036 [Gonapodya sp. JEL0774]|nr:hypothetical protein HDU93_007036 [Gonapodya sp. JEL0774]
MSPINLHTSVVLDGLNFGEAPRWKHDEQALYFADFYAYAIKKFHPASGTVSVVLQLPKGEQPSGLGWLPDRSLVFVNMKRRQLYRLPPSSSTPVLHADLSSVAEWDCNDMVVDEVGRAYVGNFGFDFPTYSAQTAARAARAARERVGGVAGHLGETDKEKEDKGSEPVILVTRKPATLALVHPSGQVSVAAKGLDFPNGPALHTASRLLIVAETLGRRLACFDVDPVTGALGDKKTWAPSFACALGGPDRKTLYVITAPDGDPKKRTASRQGRIEAVTVDFAGMGLP